MRWRTVREGAVVERRVAGSLGRRAVLVGLLAGLLVGTVGDVADGAPGRGVSGDEIGAYMERVEAERDFSGSVLVARDGEVLLHEGYGLAEEATGEPVGKDTVFGLASLAKQFTAAAILKLEEQGRLGVDDRISEHLAGVPSGKTGIKIHHLLTHTSGLTKDHARGDFEQIGREEALRRIFAKPLARAPGSGYEYSDSGYTVAAAIVEEVSGRSFQGYLHSNLFRPAGLDSTGFWDEPRFDGLPVANGYANGEDQGSPAGFPGVSWAIMGAGGQISTTGDLLRWWRTLEENTVLSEASAEKLFARHVRYGEGEYYGYGWERSEAEGLGDVITHNGAGNTGNAYFAAYPDRDLVVAVLSNRVTFRSITLGNLLEDDDLPYQVTIPADETGMRLARNIESGDFSELPSPTLPISLTLGVLGVLVAVSLGAVARRGGAAGEAAEKGGKQA